MIDRASLHLWNMRALFLALGGGILFMQLMPLPFASSGWRSPDLLLCLILIWSSRRPEYAPILLVGGLALLADLLLSRPPGLQAAITVLLADNFRRKRDRMHVQSITLEWAQAAGAILVLFVASRFALAVLLSPNVAFWPATAQMVSTIAAYPVVMALSSLVFGITRVSGAELEAGGRRV